MSAVDAHVGKHLFQKCIREHLGQSAVILVTHQLQYLRDADLIVVLKQGHIQEMGTFEHLVKNGLDFSAFLSLEEREERQSEETENIEKEPNGNIKSDMFLLDQASDKDQIQMRKRARTISVSSEVSQISRTSTGKEKSLGAPVLTKEEKSSGTIKSKVYFSYLHAGANWFAILFLLFINIVCHALFSVSDVWLAYWTKENKIEINEEDIPHPAVYFSNYSQSRYTTTIDHSFTRLCFFKH